MRKLDWYFDYIFPYAYLDKPNLFEGAEMVRLATLSKSAERKEAK